MTPWSEDQLAHIRGLVTAQRLSSYLAETSDLAAALALYEWNAQAAAAVLEIAGTVEVLVRNSMHTALTNWAAERGQPTWLEVAPLDDRGRRDIVKAVTRSRWVPGVDVGKVVAELPFGFWRYLVASRYHASLWVPCLHRAFPQGSTDIRRRRTEAEADLKSLLLLRNRAAHHEPIHKRTLARDEQTAVRLLATVDSLGADWALRCSRLQAIDDQKPTRKTGSRADRQSISRPSAGEAP